MHTAIRLKADARSAAEARRSVEWFADAAGVEVGAANVVVTELVANAVRHGAEPIVLRLRSDDASLFVEVSDAAKGALPPTAGLDTGGSAESGHGLFLVERLSRTWGVRESPRGSKTVWAQVPVAVLHRDHECEVSREGDVVVTQRGDRERRTAEYERYLSAGERKLAESGGEGQPLHQRVYLLHRVAATVHEKAAKVHDRLAQIADDRVQRLFDRYR